MCALFQYQDYNISVSIFFSQDYREYIERKESINKIQKRTPDARS